jgi:hypothetical protein
LRLVVWWYSRQTYRGKNNADQVTNNKARHPHIHWDAAQFCRMRVWRNSGRATSVKIGEVFLLPDLIPFPVKLPEPRGQVSHSKILRETNEMQCNATLETQYIAVQFCFSSF